jgi:hypothetical protein
MSSFQPYAKEAESTATARCGAYLRPLARHAAPASAASAAPAFRGYFCAISANIPKMTARAVLSSSRSISSSPKFSSLRVPPELADPLHAVEVWEAKDVEELDASRRREGFESLAEDGLDLVEVT